MVATVMCRDRAGCPACDIAGPTTARRERLGKIPRAHYHLLLSDMNGEDGEERPADSAADAVETPVPENPATEKPATEKQPAENQPKEKPKKPWIPSPGRPGIGHEIYTGFRDPKVRRAVVVIGSVGLAWVLQTLVKRGNRGHSDRTPETRMPQ
jgi:hypothetical protein